MTGDKTKFVNLFLKQEDHVTYGDNNKGKILEEEPLVTRTPSSFMMCYFGRTQA